MFPRIALEISCLFHKVNDSQVDNYQDDTQEGLVRHKDKGSVMRDNVSEQNTSVHRLI